MKLSNLDAYVPAKLYKRGVDYFEQRHVEELTEDAPNRWHAVVSGTRDYHVSIYLKGTGTILSSSCTCPFESDSLCKHEVAVCLAILERPKGKVPETVDVLAQLKALKKAELLELLEDLVERQPTINLYLAEKFSRQNGMDEEMARRIIRQSASRASRRGFIEWDRSDDAVEGALEVQAYVSGLDSEKEGERVIRLHLVIIQECTSISGMADDSSGNIGSIIQESLNGIRDVMENWPEELDEAVADGMLALFYEHIVRALEDDMNDSATELMGAVMVWYERDGYAQKIFGFIEKAIASAEMQNKKYDYDEERFRLFQLEILIQQDDMKAIEAFFQKHHGYSDIRKAEVAQAMKKSDYEGVIRLCQESEQLDAKLPGLVNDWKKLRFEAYEMLGKTEDMMALAYTFAAKGEEDYYKKLKSLVRPEKWTETLESLLQALKEAPRGRHLYISILIEEKMTEDLLEFCRANLHEIESLYLHLLENFPHEVNELYTSYIYRLIEPASNRKAYRAACVKINGFQAAMGAEAAKGLIEELQFMYPYRKALLDELSKI